MTIKRGDLVMIVGSGTPLSMRHIGKVVTAKNPSEFYPRHWETEPALDRIHWAAFRLRRIDPPATGEYYGVPVRKNVPRKQPIKETA